MPEHEPRTMVDALGGILAAVIKAASADVAAMTICLRIVEQALLH